MGIAFSKDQKFGFVFKADKEKPEAEQPKLLFRYLTARECVKVDELFNESPKAGTVTEGLAKIIEGVKIGLTGWENYPKPFKADDIDDVLTRGELIELRDSLLQEMTLTELDRKK